MKQFTSAANRVLKRMLVNFVGQISQIIHGKPRYEVVTKDKWDLQYSEGHWNRLEQLNELGRYSIIAGYFNYYFTNDFIKDGKVLDVGCGHGILQRKLAAQGYTSYMGLDISAEAIVRSSKFQNETTNFLQADINEYDTTEKFDCIIFNEILIYVESPLSIVNKYRSFLSPGGIIIISQYCNKTMDLEYSWRSIDEQFPPHDMVKIIHQSGKAWIVKTYRNLVAA